MEFNGRSEFRELGDIIPVDPMEESSVNNTHKAIALLKEVLELLEREK